MSYRQVTRFPCGPRDLFRLALLAEGKNEKRTIKLINNNTDKFKDGISRIVENIYEGECFISAHYVGSVIYLDFVLGDFIDRFVVFIRFAKSRGVSKEAWLNMFEDLF